MALKNDDLHGNAPDSSPVALMIIDMLNDLEFPEGAEFLEPTMAAARNIAKLKQQAKALGIPVVYVNDNFGRWQSNINDIIDHCLNDGVRGESVVRLLKPESDDYIVLKPKHSAFYATTLDALLAYLHTEKLILTGISTDLCVLFAANDAYMRDFVLCVPADCVAAGTTADTEAALAYMKRILQADTSPSHQLNLAELTKQS